MPAKQPQFMDVRIKGKSRDVDLQKIGITGRVRLDITGNRGNRIVEIVRLDENPVDTQTGGVHNSP